MTVFVVMGTTGEYSDRDEWAVYWFTTEAAAMDYAARARIFANELLARGRYDADGKLRRSDLDPHFCMDYNGTDYFVVAVESGDAHGATERVGVR